MFTLPFAVLLALTTSYATIIHDFVDTSPIVFATGVSSNFTASNIGPPFAHNFTLETVTGFFLQDTNSTDSSTFSVINENFGLTTANETNHWQLFASNISELNANASPGVSFRVLYMARHGEGFHNAAETFFGTPAWNAFWSKINGNENSIWGPDALLTPNGIQQAQNLSVAWRQQAAAGAPLPQSFYVSPLTRSTDTLNITWGDFVLNQLGAPVPIIVEGLRETIGVHTSDMRRSKTFIHAREPTWLFEKGFTENDELWTPSVRETADQQQARARSALVEIFNGDDSTYISITSHSGETAGLLAAIGHRPFPLDTGDFIPAVVKVTQIHSGPVNP